jgi:hypothetical protein
MSTIIAGTFKEQQQAAQVLEALMGSGFSDEEVTSFYVNPPGQHALHTGGGDEDASPGARKSGKGAAKGATVGGAVGLAAGIAAAPVIGPAGLVAAAGIGAYTGSLAGADVSTDKQTVDEGRTRQVSEQPLETTDRKAGVIVAVRADESDSQRSAIDVLKSHGAADIECARGNLARGQWSDFDPLATVTLVPH